MNGQEGLPLRFALVCATLALACTPSAIAQVLEIGPAGVTSITGPAVITADGAVAIIAPFGLEDIFGLRIRPNPLRPASGGFDRAAQSAKARWPEIAVESAA